MKSIIILIISLISLSCLNLNAQDRNAGFMGNCDSLTSNDDIRLVSYIFTAYDSLYKHSVAMSCNSAFGVVQNRKLVKTFKDIIFNNQIYFMSDLELFVVHNAYDSVLTLNEYVFEIRNSSDSVVAIDFASKVFNSNHPSDSTIKFYNSYFMQVDYVDINGATYSGLDTTEVNVFYNSSTDYLKKIIDIDRAKIVGLKYYCNANNEEYVYFFEPNN